MIKKIVANIIYWLGIVGFVGGIVLAIFALCRLVFDKGLAEFLIHGALLIGFVVVLLGFWAVVIAVWEWAGRNK